MTTLIPGTDAKSEIFSTAGQPTSVEVHVLQGERSQAGAQPHAASFTW
jgi:hypothetical protein